MEQYGTVALVGSPSSGKSTLFNRLSDSRQEITGRQFGITRDRNYGTGHWLDKEFTLIDTGGVTGENIPFQKEVQAQVELGCQQADLILFVVDGRAGLTNNDVFVAKKLYPYREKVMLVVNKIDDNTLLGNAYDFYQLGFDNPYPISAEHGIGLGDMLDDIIARLPKVESDPYKDCLTFALLGRPNVGKSSMANKIIGTNRVITSPMSGTTRDSVDIQFEREGKKYVMIDTAGIKRPGKVEEDLDKFAVIRSADAAKRADIILLLVDASEGLVSQDIHVSSYAIDNHKPVIIVVNKWDLVNHTQDAQKKFETELRTFFKFLNYAPVVFVSALTGSNIQKIFNAMNAVDENMHKTIPSSLLNSVILKAQMDNEAPDFNGGRLKISYCTQSKDVPPTFVMFCNNPNYFHFSYQRYLENVIRTQFGFDNCPIRLLIRSKRDDMLKKN
ncbi:ribosome biogenesis GTPase Der [Treponema rectale]|uniref:GTPase Der n=1 Tax=Treponema rectale TaxID=744512 RepID=A0A7M1XJJ0_9SPIR|nr:ribosome biogenesis GTPase Der [Treponema rectale]